MTLTTRLKDALPPRCRVGLTVATTAACAALGWQGVGWYDRHQEDESRAAAIAVARAQVLDLTTLDADTVEDKLAAMGKRMSGEFKRQFDGFAQTFADVVDGDRIRASGEVVSVAVDRWDDGAASVIVATSADVTHGKDEATSHKDYRLRVQLDREDDRWLITGMEFVG